MSKPEQNWDWASQEAQQIEDEYITQESLRELISDALRKAAANERALVQAEIEGLAAERDHYRQSLAKLQAALSQCEQQKERLREKLRHETATTRKFAAEFEKKLAKLAGERPEKA